MSVTYLGTEIRRTFRSPRFVIFAIAFPVLMFLLQANLFLKPSDKDYTAYVTILMVNMMVFGTLAGAMSNGAKLALERASGWQRQLRLTPLSGSGYLGAKVVSGMLVGLPALIAVPLVGAFAEKVDLGVMGWVELVAGLWLASIPFILLGLLLGQFGSPDSLQPVTMLVMMGMGMLGGLWIPVEAAPGWLHNIAQVLPSYWITRIGHGIVSADFGGQFGKAVLVVGGWAVVLGVLMIKRYRKDSARV